MVRLLGSGEDSAVLWIFLPHDGGSLETVYKQAGPPMAVSVRQKVEKLKSSRVSEICVVCMRA